MNIGIIGLGLIGGSMAKSIKHKTAHTVYAADTNHETMMLARMCGAIDGQLTDENMASCDILLIAIRPDAAVNWIENNADKISTDTTVIDLCGVKRSVVSRIAPIAREKGFGYIGGHPMAGKERGGFVNASDSLFNGASMILTTDERTEIKILEMLKAFFTDIGFSSLTFTTPEEHDHIIAYTSQLAHIASSAYVKSPEAQRRRGFSAGSFQDMTRVAFLDEDMWTELFSENADYLANELELYINHLTEYLDVIRSGDKEQLKALLKDGKNKKATAGGN